MGSSLLSLLVFIPGHRGLVSGEDGLSKQAFKSSKVLTIPEPEDDMLKSGVTLPSWLTSTKRRNIRLSHARGWCWWYCMAILLRGPQHFPWLISFRMDGPLLFALGPLSIF